MFSDCIFLKVHATDNEVVQSSSCLVLQADKHLLLLFNSLDS